MANKSGLAKVLADVRQKMYSDSIYGNIPRGDELLDSVIYNVAEYYRDKAREEGKTFNRSEFISAAMPDLIDE